MGEHPANPEFSERRAERVDGFALMVWEPAKRPDRHLRCLQHWIGHTHVRVGIRARYWHRMDSDPQRSPDHPAVVPGRVLLSDLQHHRARSISAGVDAGVAVGESDDYLDRIFSVFLLFQ